MNLPTSYSTLRGTFSLGHRLEICSRWRSEYAAYVEYNHYGSPQRLIGNVWIGIDPGAQFGFTMIDQNMSIISIYGKLLGKQPEEVEAYYATKELLGYYEVEHTVSGAIIENAAFGAQFGQVSLASKRAGFLLGLWDTTHNIIKLPPATIRKRVLGSAKLDAKLLWPRVNGNAADSIIMAMLSYATQ